MQAEKKLDWYKKKN